MELLIEIYAKWIVIKLNSIVSVFVSKRRENIKIVTFVLKFLLQFAEPTVSNMTTNANVFVREHARNIVMEVVQRKNHVLDAQVY